MLRELQSKFDIHQYNSAMKGIDTSMQRLRRSFDDLTEDHPADAETTRHDDYIKLTNDVSVDVRHIVKLLNNKKDCLTDDTLERLSCVYRQLVMLKDRARQMKTPSGYQERDMPLRITEIMLEFDRITDDALRHDITGR